MVAAGVFSSVDRAELLDGWIVVKMPQNPSHAWALQKTEERIGHAMPGGWCVRTQLPVTLDESEPEPDVAVVRGSRADYAQRHPRADDVGLLVEIADSSLQQDRAWKGAIYAGAGIPAYWIINLVSEQIEVYETPTGADSSPMFGRQQTYHRGESVPLVLDGRQAALIPVDDLLP
jgi:Uma2 family endonuclease